MIPLKISRISTMKRFFLITSSLFALGACASIADKQSHLVTVETPGATNARCILENEDMRYRAHSGETIEIMKSPHDLVVHCQAPGNREQTVHVKRTVNDWVFVNVANGFVPGASYDYFSRGAFDYPDVITVSFVSMPVKPYPLPEHYNDDLGHYAYDNIEYMGPTTKITNATRYKEPDVLQKRPDNYGTSEYQYLSPESGATDSLHKQYNPKSTYNPSEEDK